MQGRIVATARHEPQIVRLLMLANLVLLIVPAGAAPRVRRPPRLPPVPEPQAKDQFRAQLDAGPKIEAERKALERLAAAKQWDSWLRGYQRLLDEHPDGLLAAGEGRWVGLARSLRDRFRQLPDAVHDRYRRQYDGAAAEAVQRAIEKNSPADVARCYIRYRFTTSGPHALAWMAERALDGGDAERP